MHKNARPASSVQPSTGNRRLFLWVTSKCPIILLLVGAIFLFPVCRCQEALCASRETCSQCITAHPDCAWCSEVVDRADDRWSSLRQMRCGRRESLEAVCNKSDLAYPQSSAKNLIDHPLGPTVGSLEDVQIRPQRVRIQLRTGRLFSFPLEFKQAKDYPVDLYYLMDLSYTMNDDKNNLVKLGQDLILAMKNVTSKFQIGFGSFVDKVALPFTSTVKSRLLDPCRASCSPPYGFRNHLPLSANTDRFTRKVNETRISGNLDAPEGSFDAIMQILLCQKEIGWRSKSRKLLLLATDGRFHFAGDGKLAGIVKPNDEKCHLDDMGLYTESLNQDYPTFAQVRRQIRQSKVNLIMAVTADVIETYNRLQGFLEGSSTGALDRDSKNVVELVRAQYDAITDFVELKDNSSRHIQISYFSACTDGRYEERKRCVGLKVGTNVTFDIQIKATTCPADVKDRTEFVQIYPVGLNESMIIEVNLICECDCEKPEQEERRSPKCSNGHGTFECGICSCDKNRYGKDCECSLVNKTTQQDTTPCFRANDTRQCSGQGSCVCGQCLCDLREDRSEIISGVYCEIDNYNCNRTNGKICSGNGQCAFKKCTCNPGWTGDTCECTNATCYEKNQDAICSGHGTCDCGRCLCDVQSGELYYGAFCEIKNTITDLCNEWNDCMVCKAGNTDSNDEEECKPVCTLNDNNPALMSGRELACPFVGDKVTCNYIFKYNSNSKELDVREDCSKDNTLPIVLGSVGGTVAVGLFMLMLWKITTSIHDSREYAKFENEKKNAVWIAGNPIYKEATTEFQNPTFGHRISKMPEPK